MSERMRLISFKPLRKGTSLRGFAEVEIPVIGMQIPDVPVHSQGSSKWAQIPGKAQITGDQLVRTDRGKIAYTPVFRFSSEKLRQAFCSRVVELVQRHHPEALR